MLLSKELMPVAPKSRPTCCKPPVGGSVFCTGTSQICAQSVIRRPGCGRACTEAQSGGEKTCHASHLELVAQ